MGELIGFVYNERVPEAQGLARCLATDLGLAARSWLFPAGGLEEARELLPETSLVVTVGGDGTILRTVRVVSPHGIPLVGVNMGRVGFMTELAVGEALERLPRYLNGHCRVEERMMLRARVLSGPDGETAAGFHALNDVVVGRGAVARLVDVAVSIDGAAMSTYRADGVIVATATGSTGYALSVGGPIVYPEARVMLVEPIAAHISFDIGVVLPGDSIVDLEVVGGQEAILSIDGFVDTPLSDGAVVRVDRSPHVARFLRAAPPAAFYASLPRRLGIGSRRREGP